MSTTGTFSCVRIQSCKDISDCCDGDSAYLKVQGIEKILPTSRGGDLMQRLLYREAYWIFTLETRQPKGLNMRFDVACCV
ncbi:hypothetical protein XELAEV_18012465mg [Xenopus laevis]|uniref:Uncharacterized protein n=1 Tax=Xenopus laevis TaxID=8355 RepID=A0A974HYA5_XENLA|nr:hypothetical protein XELAEV_18012465mg [Xenopus laevis]